MSALCVTALSFLLYRPLTKFFRNLDRAFSRTSFSVSIAPMLDRIPVELAIRIAQHAAFHFRFSTTHRRSAVHLAMTSHTIYDIVAPIIYHTLIINRRNDVRIRSFMFSEDGQVAAAAARMCSYVRVLHYPGLIGKINTRLLTSLERVYGMGDVIEEIFERVDTSQPCSLRHITVISAFFAQEVLKLPIYIRSHVTHACGFLPLFLDHHFERMQKIPAEWTREILDALPKVTHLGLILVNVRPPDQVSPIVNLFDMDALRIVVQTALGHRDDRLQRVALHVAGRYIERRRSTIEEMVQQINNSRFGVWWDARELFSWDQWNGYETEDLIQGHDIWTEA